MSISLTCGNCRFSLPATDGKGKINFGQRFCRANPPSVVMMPTQQGPQFVSAWPVMGSSDYCFSHERAAYELPLPGENKPEGEQKADA